MRYLPFALALSLTLALVLALPTPATADDDLEAMVSAIAKVRFCGSPSFSPDGEQMTFISDLTGVPQVWRVDAGGGWPHLVTDLDDQLSNAAWSPTGEWIAFTLAPGGGLDQQIYVVRPDGSDLRRISAGGGEGNFQGEWTPDGRWLVFSSNERDPRFIDAKAFEAETGTVRPLLEGQGFQFISHLDEAKERAVVWRMKSRGDNNLLLVDLASGDEALLTPHEGPGSFGGGRFSKDGKTIYLSSNAGRDLIGFARVRLDEEGKPGPIEDLLTRDDAELSSFTLSPDGATVALVWNAGGRSELELRSLESLGRLATPKLPSEIVRGLTFSKNGRQLAFVATGAGQPADIWTLEVDGGALRQVTHSPHAGLDLDTFVRPELVRYRAHDDLELSGWLYRPPGVEGPAPYVINFHGGPESQARPSFNGAFQGLLRRGIGIFDANVRGSSGFGKEFVNLDNGALRMNAVKDIEATVGHLASAGIAHPQRIGIMGGSYGGYMTMAGLGWYPDLFAAGANLFGVVNFETFFKHTEPWMAAVSTVEYGDPDTEAEMLRRISPIHQIDNVTAPTLVLHGANDTNVPVVEAEQVVERLETRGVPVKYVLFEDEGHGFRKTKNRITSAVEIVRWFDEQLKRPLPDTASAAGR